MSFVKLKYLNRGFCVAKLHVKHFILRFYFKYENKIVSLKLKIEIFDSQSLILNSFEDQTVKSLLSDTVCLKCQQLINNYSSPSIV